MARHRAPSAGSRALTTVTLTGAALGISMATLAGSALAATAPGHGAQPAEPLGEHPATATPTADHLHPHSRGHHPAGSGVHHTSAHHTPAHHSTGHGVHHSTPAHHTPATGTAPHTGHHPGAHGRHHHRHHRHHGGGGLF